MKESLEISIAIGNMKEILSDQLRFAHIPNLSYMQPERLNPETQPLCCQMCNEKELDSENPPFLCQSCKKKDEEMGRYYGSRIRIVEIR